MNVNPPIKGHALINEGQIRIRVNRYGAREVVGGCQCSAIPDHWGRLSVNDVKRWHRQHKAELRALTSPSL